MRTESLAHELLDRARSIGGSKGYLSDSLLGELTRDAIRALSSDPAETRPLSAAGEPGGLVRLKTPFVAIVPDLHARADLLLDILASSYPFFDGTQLLDMALDGRLTIVCLGDILNSEGRLGADRWGRVALHLVNSRGLEGLLGPEMDEEMGSSMAAMGLVMLLKARLGAGFHCLKGNHDNISNTSMDGDAGFSKFALEGAMGAEWFRLRYGDDLIHQVRQYERLLPLVAAGRRFCASHAEPAFALGMDELLDYRKRADIVGALIWTGNDQAAEGAVNACLSALLGAEGMEEGFWIAGHRSVQDGYALRAGGKLIQIHNPERRQFAWIENGEDSKTASAALYEVGEGGGSPTFLKVLPRLHLDHRKQGH
ncbi:MAG: hypothetical protein CVV53_05745 [Spirochaetae bacterium HGW-Spirochaetae-9]|nr:MAG: hypothetical protein CVV53_05745 [Spirochaetae bacterium HGW-Spirochaetae-9]